MCKIKLRVQVANHRNNTPDAAKCTVGRKENFAEFHPQKTSIRAWSGCDTISHFYEICKVLAFHTFSNSKHLFLLGMEDTASDEVISAATSFIANCDTKCGNDISEVVENGYKNSQA